MKKIKMFTSHIDCPIFSEYEANIKKLSASLNGHKVISKKVGKAQELLQIINILSSCPKYDEENEDCENCRFILGLSKENTRTIIEASEIHL